MTQYKVGDRDATLDDVIVRLERFSMMLGVASALLMTMRTLIPEGQNIEFDRGIEWWNQAIDDVVYQHKPLPKMGWNK